MGSISRDTGKARQERQVVLLRENRRKAATEDVCLRVAEGTLCDARRLVLERLDPRARGVGDEGVVRCVTRVQACPEDPWPSCVAAELALLAIGDQAALMAPDELLPTVEPFDAEAYMEPRMQDDDVRLLWSRDGRQAIALEALDFVNLDLASWFVPFFNATHPVAAMPSPADTADWIRLNSYESAADDP